MILLVDARNLGTKPSGVGMYAYNFIEQLSKYNDIEMHVIVDVAESTEILMLRKNARINVHSYGKLVNKSVYVYKYFKYVKQIIDEVKPNVFWETNNLSPIRLENPYGKFIVTIHDVFPLTMPKYYKKTYPMYFRIGVNKTLRNCDGVVYNSITTRKTVEKFFPKAKNKKSYISYIIIPSIRKTECAEKYGFLYMGNLEKRKGTDILLKAYDRYIEKGGKQELHIAGKICEADIEEQLQKNLSRNKTLKYLGYVNGSEKIENYNACRCFIFPSRAEGFGMPIIEALSCGKNVIASNLDIFTEIVGNYVIQFSLDLNAEKAAENLSECMLRYDIHHEKVDCSDLVSKYSESKLAPQMYEFLKELV